MALSEQVELSLRDAQENLRNALSFSARSEKPFISKHMLMRFFAHRTTYERKSDESLIFNLKSYTCSK